MLSNISSEAEDVTDDEYEPEEVDENGSDANDESEVAVDGSDYQPEVPDDGSDLEYGSEKGDEDGSDAEYEPEEGDEVGSDADEYEPDVPEVGSDVDDESGEPDMGVDGANQALETEEVCLVNRLNSCFLKQCIA